jgi:FAD/FMN-containing dehydrogenase
MAAAFTGQLLRAGASGFGQAARSRVFNARQPARMPAAVLRAADEADVAAGVRMARAEGLQVAVRSGGHSWPAWSLREDTLLIDLAAFTAMSYDDETGIVTAGPAVRGGLDLDPFLAARDRFFAGGHCPAVGIGGFLLQGGMGWNCRGWGWAAEQVESVRVVTADGEAVEASATGNPDLFWAARGCGPGFFGVVTEFRLRTMPRFRQLTQTTHVYPAELAEEVLSWLHCARHDVPPSVELVAVGNTPPLSPAALPPGPGYRGPVLVVDGVSFDGGPQSLRALEACPVAGKALMARIAQPADIADLRAEQIRANPEGHRYFVDNAYLAGDAAALIPALAPAFTGLPTPKSFSLWFDLAHLPARPLPDMALSLQADIYFATYVVCEDPADDPACREFTDATMARLEPFSPGCYLGDSDFTVRPDRFMSDEAWRRYQAIRASRDPERRFAGYLTAGEAALNTRRAGNRRAART